MTTAAPVRFTNTITIDRPPARVFAYLADLEHLPRWNYAIHETRKITSGPVNVGSRYRQTRTVPVRSEEFLEVTEFERDRRLAIAGRLNAFPARITYVLDPAGSATTLTNTVELAPPRPLSLLAPLATRRISAAVAANLEALKHELERGFYGNQTQSQIAAQLGISQMHVSRLLARTLAKLREQLTD